MQRSVNELSLRTLVKRFIKTQPDFEDFVYNENYIPEPEKRLAGIINNPKIIIIGQDPYPRRRSACGISFYDAALQNSKHTGAKTSIDNIISYLGFGDKNIDYGKFFENTMSQGVMWLNSSLTFEKVDKNENKDQKTIRQKHQRFWKPVFQYICQNVGPVLYICFGKEAQTLMEQTQRDKDSRVLNLPHPSPITKQVFYDLKRKIDDNQKEMKQKLIKWDLGQDL